MFVSATDVILLLVCYAVVSFVEIFMLLDMLLWLLVVIKFDVLLLLVFLKCCFGCCW